MSIHSCITVFTRRFLPAVLLPLLLQSSSLPLVAQVQKVRLVVTVTGIRNDKGHIAASLFDGEKGFPNDDARAVAHQLGPIKDRTATITFDSLPPGNYGVALLHDENKNNKMDSNRFGFPREGYGVSNNPRPTRRRPRFTDARFTVSQTSKEQSIAIKVVYLRLGDVLR
ncbi:MAG: DUF2141 domain-containing protein [Armatimonadota bacterium]